MSELHVHVPGSNENATADEITFLVRHGLWDATGDPDSGSWTQWAVLDAYRAGFCDGQAAAVRPSGPASGGAA